MERVRVPILPKDLGERRRNELGGKDHRLLPDVRKGAGRKRRHRRGRYAVLRRACSASSGSFIWSSAAAATSEAPPFHAASPYAPSQPPPLPRADESVSPPLAFILGFIPGVGAVYNGQYAKGLVHVVIFGSIISILSSGAAQGFVPLFGLMIPTFVFYMAFEAYHTAKKRRDGEMVDEFSGLVRARRTHARDFLWRRYC